MTNEKKEELREKWHIKSVNMAREVKDYSKVESMIFDYFFEQFDNIINEKIERIANIQVDLCENSQEFKNNVITILKE